MRSKCMLILFFLTVSALASNSITNDIFKNTDETRRTARDGEFEMLLKLHGCAGFLIGPNLAASAAHCESSGSVKSGMALLHGDTSDATIGKTLELGSADGDDYWIFEIRWSSGQLPHGMRFVPFIQIESSQLKIGPNPTADKIYTLGFPADISHGKLISSWGYGKSDGANSLMKNNISLINGNSGGGIWREMDDLLVSIVSGGPHQLGEPGWSGNDWEDAKHWNWGPALWKVYQKSSVLKETFPGGKNKYTGGMWELDRASLVSFLRSF